MAKGTSWAEAMSNIDKIKPINFLKAFRVNLKACLGLVLPNQYCPMVI